MVPVSDRQMEPREAEDRPEALRSLVDLTIDPEEMLRARDDLRADLLRQYYALLMVLGLTVFLLALVRYL